MTDVSMTPVQSSHVAAAGYDEETGTLVVEFKGGKQYSWRGASAAEYTDIVQGGSAGAGVRAVESRLGPGSRL